MGLRRLVLSGRTLIVLAVAWVVLFVIGGAAFNGHTTADNVVWPIIFVALFLLVLLGIVALGALVQSRRSRER
jgi:cytochrome c biogenesis protein CcdA